MNFTLKALSGVCLATLVLTAAYGLSRPLHAAMLEDGLIHETAKTKVRLGPVEATLVIYDYK